MICINDNQLNYYLKKLRNKNDIKIVFTNGCFDIIHIGHIKLLEEAKSRGNFLIVGLNSDSSIKKIKGELRPIITEEMRAKVLNSISFVDLVYIFKEETPLKLIEKIRPDILVKGGDWKTEEIVGATYVKGYGGEVFISELYPEISTTKIIIEILNRYGRKL